MTSLNNSTEGKCEHGARVYVSEGLFGLTQGTVVRRQRRPVDRIRVRVCEKNPHFSSNSQRKTETRSKTTEKKPINSLSFT